MSSSSSMTRTLPRLEGEVSGCIYRLPNRAGCSEREFQMERGAAVAPIEHFDRTAMLLNDTVGHRKSETGALARRLGGEEGIVDAVNVLRSNAGSCIGHFYFDAHAVAPGTYFKGAAR